MATCLIPLLLWGCGEWPFAIVGREVHGSCYSPLPACTGNSQCGSSQCRQVRNVRHLAAVIGALLGQALKIRLKFSVVVRTSCFWPLGCTVLMGQLSRQPLASPWQSATKGGRPLVASHRAGGNEAPENTLAAIRHAQSVGSKVGSDVSLRLERTA